MFEKIIWVLKGHSALKSCFRMWSDGKKCSPEIEQRNKGNRKHTKLHLLVIQFLRTGVKG